MSYASLNLPGHGILCLESLKFIQCIRHIWTNSHSSTGWVKKKAYKILEWWFVQICVIYRIKFKLPKHKIPCPGLIYQVIQGCIWLFFSYMAFDQRVKWYFTDLKAIFMWIRIFILNISNISILPLDPSPPFWYLIFK